jgi:hypothetical protein
MIVGSIRTTANPPLTSGIYEALLEKAERERDHYKKGLEEISVTIDDWLNSLVQEPPDDFIHAIKAWADKKLNNG